VAGDFFEILYDMTSHIPLPDPDPFTPPYTRALWTLFSVSDVPSTLGNLQVVVFDSSNTVLGSELVDLELLRPFYPILSWATVIDETTDPVGHVRFSGAAFDVDLSRSSVLLGNDLILPGIPLPATLPLFATGLGALGLLGWRRRRKNAAAIAA